MVGPNSFRLMDLNLVEDAVNLEMKKDKNASTHIEIAHAGAVIAVNMYWKQELIHLMNFWSPALSFHQAKTDDELVRYLKLNNHPIKSWHHRMGNDALADHMLLQVVVSTRRERGL